MPRKNLSKPLKVLVGLTLLFAASARADLCRAVASLMPESLFQWGIGKEFSDDRVELYLAVKYSILNVPNPNPALRKLGQILTTPRESQGSDPQGLELQSRLKAWAQEFEIPFEFVFPEGLPQLLKRQKGKSGLERQPFVQNENGFLDFGSYKTAVLEGKWPILDPHDLINHLPDLTDPAWRRELIHHAEVLDRVRKFTLEGFDPASEKVDEFLRSSVRVVTYEGNSGLSLNPKGEPQLTLRGATGMTVVRRITAGEDAFSISNRLVPASFGSPEEWPLFHDYLAARGADLYERQRLAGEKVASGRKQRALVLNRVEVLLTTILPKVEKSFSAEERVDFVMAELAKGLHQDPLLRDVFNSNNRLEALKLSLDLSEDYLSWNYPK